MAVVHIERGPAAAAGEAIEQFLVRSQFDLHRAGAQLDGRRRHRVNPSSHRGRRRGCRPDDSGRLPNRALRSIASRARRSPNDEHRID
jgi:hypothetical protein